MCLFLIDVRQPTSLVVHVTVGVVGLVLVLTVVLLLPVVEVHQVLVPEPAGGRV